MWASVGYDTCVLSIMWDKWRNLKEDDGNYVHAEGKTRKSHFKKICGGPCEWETFLFCYQGPICGASAKCTIVGHALALAENHQGLLIKWPKNNFLLSKTLFAATVRKSGSQPHGACSDLMRWKQPWWDSGRRQDWTTCSQRFMHWHSKIKFDTAHSGKSVQYPETLSDYLEICLTAFLFPGGSF